MFCNIRLEKNMSQKYDWNKSMQQVLRKSKSIQRTQVLEYFDIARQTY